MPVLPAVNDFTGSGITEAEFKTAMTNLRGFLADLLGVDGTAVAAQVALKALLGAGVSARSGAYTVAISDRGQLINATGTWSLALPSAATAGAGFAFALRNSGTGVITVDPNEAELIDGATTITVAARASCLIVCTGAAWLTVGLAAPISYPISVANGGTGATDVNGARTNLSVVARDNGHGNVGSLCFAINTSSTQISPGGTIAGSYLKPYGLCLFDTEGPTNYQAIHATALSGTWRCLGYAPSTNTVPVTRYSTLWQRIS